MRGTERRVHGLLFSLAISPLAQGETTTKFACVVSKKVSPKAVERNRIKRRCREAARAFMSDDSPRALVFVAKRTARDATSGDLTRDIESLLKKI